MSKLILVTGGARSGKSDYAESLAKNFEGNVLYIATSIAFDGEMRLRIKKHRESRPREWDTYEGFKGLGEVITERSNSHKAILLDCVTIMTTNLIFDYLGLDCENPSTEDFEKAEAYVKSEVELLLKGIENTDLTVIMVTNEVGSGIVPENKFARAFRDIAGRVNRQIAANADEVYLVVCGIPMKIK